MSIILFIDPNIPDYQILKDSVKINTIDFNLKNFDYLASRIGFIWANSNTRMPFGSTDYYFDELDRDNNKIKSIYFTGEIVELIESYGQTPLTIDLITCNFNNSFFEIELGYLNTKFPNLTVNYSTNLTGNPNNGDWIMESSNENIADIYFNEHIVNYKETLDIITPISIPSGNRFSDTNTVWTTLTETFTDIESLGLGIPIQILSAGVDDKVSTVYPIGFKIVFFNTIYEYFSVSPNGLVQLLKSNSTNPITTSYQSANINNISTPSIAIGWSDLYLIGDGIRYVSNLTSKSLVIEWNAKKYDDTLNNMIKMQVKIESNGNISFNIHQPNTIQSTQPFVIGIFNSLTEYYTYDTVNVYKNQYMYYTQSGTISFPQMTNKKIKMQPTLTPGLGYKFVEGYYNGISSYFTYAIPYITGNKITEIATIAGGVNNEVGTARDYFSVEWTGYFRPNRTGNWKFKTISDDASHLWVGANAGSTELIASNSDGSIYMKANTDYFIRINYGEYGGGEIMEVYFKFQDDSQYMTNGYGYFWQENPDLKPTLFWKKNSNKEPILDNFNKLIINSNTQPFTINPPTSNSLGAFVYTSSDTSVIDINQTTGYVQVKGVGTAIITATQQAYDIYSSGSTYTKIFVQQAPTFTNFYTDPITHVNKVTLLLKLNDYYPITKPVSNSLGAFTYTSSNPSVAQVINDSIYIKSKGVTTITATQAATDEYVESSISAEFTINIKPTFDYFYTSKQIGTRPQIFTSNSLDAPLVLTVKNDIYASCVSIVKVGEKQVVSYVKPTPPGQYVTINISQAASGQFETYNEDIQFQITVGNTSKIYSLKSLQNMEYIDNNECRMNKNDLLTRIGNGKWLSKNLFTVKDTDLLKWLVMNFIKTSDYNYKVYSFYYDSEPMETIDINFDQTTWTDQGDWFGVLNTVTITVSPDSRTLTYGKSLSLGVISDENKTGNYTVTNSPNLFFGKDKVTSVRLSYETIVNSQLNSMNITPTNLNAGYYSNVIKSSEISGLGTNINDYIIVYNSNHLTVERETPTFNSYHDHLVPLGQSEFALSEITSTNTDSLKPAITYALSNESVATINGRLITTKALGTTSIIITQPASTNFNSVTISNYTLTVTKADTNLGTFSISNKVYGASDFLVPKPSTNNSTGVFTFYSNKPEIASIGEFTGIITIHKVNDIIGVSSNTVEIEIRQGASNTHNASNPVYASFTITKATPILTTFTIGSKTYGDEPFPVPHQTSASDGALIFESSDPSIASIDSNGLITIHDGGSVDIIIKQLETNKYLDSAFVSAELTINPAVALLETFEISDKTYGDEPFSFTLPKTNSNGTLTYSSSLSGVASIGSDGLITINGANQENQTVTITVGQNPTSKYSAPTPKTATFKVNKATLSTTATSSKLKITQLDFSTATKKVGYSSLISAPTSASTGAFTYYSSNPEFVSVLVLESVPTLVFKKAGTSLITFKQAATSNYNEYISEPVELIVSEAKPVLSDFTINDLEPVVFTQGKINFTKPVCTSNGNIVTSHQTYTSSDTTVATIDTNGEITILKVGTTIITVSQDAITDYYEAPNPVSTDLTITQAPATFTFKYEGSATITKTYLDEPFDIYYPVTGDLGDFVYDFTSSSNLVKLTDKPTEGKLTVEILGASTTPITITAKRYETTNYLEGEQSITLTVNKYTQTLTGFGIVKVVNDSAFALSKDDLIGNTDSDSTGEFTYAIKSGNSNVPVVSINSGSISWEKSGSVTLIATQQADLNYTETSVEFDLTIGKITPTLPEITLSKTPLEYNDKTFTVVIPEETDTFGGETFTYTYEVLPTVDDKLIAEYNFDQNKFNILNTGTTKIRVTRIESEYYNLGTKEIVLVIDQSSPSFQLDPISLTYGQSPVSPGVPTSSDDFAVGTDFIYSYDIETDYQSYLTIGTDGKFEIHQATGVVPAVMVVSREATDFYTAGTISVEITINQAQAAFAFEYNGSNTITKTYLDKPFDIPYPVTGDLGDFEYMFTADSNLVELTDKPTEGKLTVEILGATTSETPIIITAKRTETTNYLEGEQNIILNVNKYTQHLTEFSIVKVVNDSAFALSKDDLIGNTDSDSTGEFTYAIKSGDSNVPSVSIDESGLISWTKSGLVTLVATQQADLNYTETSVEFDLTIGKITPTLPTITLSKTQLEYNDKTFTVVIPEETDTFGGETFTYTYEVLPTVDDKLIAEYNSDQNKFNILNTGTTKIRVTRIESEYYNLGTKEIDLVIDQSIPLFTLDSISLTYGQTPLAPGVPTSSDDLAVGTDFIYSYDIETDSQSYLTIGTDGKFEIHQATGVVPAVMVVSREATDFYTAGKIPVNITINQAPADFTFEYEGSTTITKTYLDVPFDILYPVTGDLGDFEYVFTTDSNLVELTDKPTERKLTVEILGATTSETPITIIAKRTETTNYLEGEQSIRLNIARAQTELTDIVVTGKTMGNKVFTINKPTSNNSAGGFSYAISSDSVGTATIEKDLDENAVVTMISGGLIIINVTQAGTDNFLSGSSTITIDVAKISADFSNLHFAGPVVFAPNTYIVIDFEDYDNETGSPIKFESSESSVAVIDESVDPETQVKSIIIRIVGAGSSTISATQESDGTFLEKTITYDLEVSKADGNFTFNTDITKTYLDKEFRISYPTTEDIDDFTYVFETTNELIATIEKVLDEPYLAVKILGASETPVKITARRLATTNYKLVEKSFNLTINKSTQTLTPIIINKVISLGNFIIEKDFLLTESESSSTGDFTLSMDQSEIASISTENNNKIELNSIGQVQITATQFSDSNFTEQSVMITLNVNKIPLPIGGFKSSQLTYQFTDGEFTLEQIDELDIFRNDQFNYTFGVLEEVKHIQYVSGTKFAILGAGTNKIIITRTSEYYEETTMEIDIIINPSVPTFTGNFNQINAHTMDGNIDVKAICNPVSNSTNPVKFSSGNSSIATVNETSGLVTLTKKAGTVIISAYVDATDNFTYGNTEITLKVDKSIGNFSFSIDQQLNYESVSFDIPQPASLDIMDKDINNQPIPFVYSYEILPGDNQEKVLKIVNDKFAIDDVGSSTIRVTRAATGIYQESFIDVPVQVLPADATFSSETKLTYNFEYIDNTFELELPKTTDTSGDNSEFTYKFVSTETSITVNEDTGFVSINKAGNSLIVQVTRLATKYYNAGIINYTINIAKSTPVILDTLNETVFPLLTKTIIDPSFTITDIYGLESNSSSGFTYSLTPNNQVASMEDNVITINSLGSCEIIASLASDDNFVAREIKTTFTVIKANSTFTFTISNTKKYSDENFSADTLGTIDTSDITDGEIPFIYSYSIVQLDDKPLVATVNEFGIVNICDVGESKVIVTRQETSKYYSGTADATLSVLPGNPTFVTESFPLVQKEYIDKSHQLVKPQTTDVNKDSSLFTYTYTSSDFKIAPVNVNTGLVTFNKAGNVTITAHRAGTKYYEPGTIKCDIEISKSNPTLQVDESINTTFEELDPVIAVSNTNSGNKVPIGKITFKSDNHDVVRMQGNKMLIYGSGDAQILVKQEADANYNQVTKPISVTINKKEPTITYTNVISKKLNDLPFNIPNPKSDSLGKFTFACAEVDSPVITITESGLVNIIGLGTANIIVTQEFNQWFESKQVSIQIVVKERPQLSWVTTIMKQIGSASFELVHPTTNSSGLFTFSSSDSSVASVNGSIVTIVGSGRAFIKAHQAESTNYCSDEILTTLVVYAEGNNLSDLDLSGANLSYMNLSGFNISNSDLSRVDFSGSNLSGANLSKSDLTGAKLHLANLINAQLGETDLSETDMHLTNIIGNSYKVTNVPEVLPFGWYYNGIIQNIVKSSRKLISSNMLDENINEKLVNMDFVNNTLANEQVITFGKTLKLETIVIPANEKQMYDYNCLIKENLLPEQTWSPSFILPNLNIEVSIEVPANSQIKKIAVGIKSLNEFKNGNKKFNGRDILSSLLILPIDSANQVVRNLNSSINVTVTNLLTSLDFTLLCLSNNPLTYFKSQFRVGNSYKFVVNELGEFLLTNYFVFSQVW